MIRVSSKNTFIDVAVDSDEEDDIPPRARSAEAVLWSRSFGDSLNELARQSLQRLNAVLSIGIAGGASQQMIAKELDSTNGYSTKEDHHDEDVNELRNLKERLGNALVEKGQQSNSIDELRNLQERLGKALQAPFPLDENTRMALLAETTHTQQVSRMRRVSSSGSVSTMASEWSDCIEAGDEGDISSGSSGSQDQQGGEECSRTPMPKTQPWSEIQDTEEVDAFTTVMIRNVPSRYSKRDLTNDLISLGFSGTFDFLYMPVDSSTSANLGYAFVNFIDTSFAAKCMESFRSYPFKRNQRRRPYKVASVSVAHLQGLEMNLRNAAVTGTNSVEPIKLDRTVYDNSSKASSPNRSDD